MTYFSIDDMPEGATARLFVEVQLGYDFPPDKAVSVTRTPGGFRYVSDFGGETFADMTVQPNPGHQGLNAHVRAACGAPYAIASRDSAQVIRDAFRAHRAAGYPAAAALIRARTAVVWHWQCRKALAAAESEVARQRAIDGRRFAPGLVKAEADLKEARAAERRAAAMVRTYTGRTGPGKRGLILSTAGGPALTQGDGAAYKCGGYLVRWIEAPESRGLRFVGLQDDAARKADMRLDATGYYLDNDGGETVSGVVYQLPARKGRTRFLAGYADPHNCDKEGRGPACLAVEMFESEDVTPGPVTYRTWTPAGYTSRKVWKTRHEKQEDGTQDALRAAVGAAAAIAESMAEAEREYQEAYTAGRKARDKAAEARKAGLAWVESMRDLRTAWAARLGEVRTRRFAGGEVRTVYRGLRAAVAAVRADCESYLEARKEARDAIDDSRPGRYRGESVLDGWKCGYADGGE
jgi:hypothetical protein